LRRKIILQDHRNLLVLLVYVSWWISHEGR
jgi:hypothetical protein